MLTSIFGGSSTWYIGLIIVIGLVGIVVPVLPGLIVIWVAIALWSVGIGTPTGWMVLVVVSALMVAGTVVRYLVPERRLRASGVPWASSAAGIGLGIAGFFVIPVIGLFIGFVAGIYLAERLRLGNHARAWTSTRTALRVAGLSLVIELIAGLAMATTWLVAALTIG